MEQLVAMYQKQIDSAEATIDVLESKGEYATALEYRTFILRISQEIYFVTNNRNQQQQGEQ